MDKNQITIVTALIRNEQGEILLSRRNQPDIPLVHNKWQFIGGGIEFGEDPETAIIREVAEEAGLVVEVKRLLPKILTHVWNLEQRNDQIIILTYECTVVSGTPNSDLDEETGELKYFKPEEIQNLDTLPNIEEAVKLFVKS